MGNREGLEAGLQGTRGNAAGAGGLEMFITLTVGMVSKVHTYVRVYQWSTSNAQFFICQLCLNKV